MSSRKKKSIQHKAFAVISPFRFRDRLTGDTVSVSVSPYYSKITINKRTCYFCRETGKFDGTSQAVSASGRAGA